MSVDDHGDDLEAFGPQNITVPVVTDGVPRTGNAPLLARCVYFSITADDPNLPCLLDLQGYQIPFLLLGMEGIIFYPLLGGPRLFESPDDWNAIITAIEQLDGFSVEFEYFWVPGGLLDRARRLYPTNDDSPNGNAVRGEVYRLSRKLFKEAWRAARDGTDFEGYAARALDNFDAEGPRTGLVYSPRETISLQQWAVAQEATARIG